ncbi:putative phosphatidylglycerol/phosphatidylinositol transfer protein DDB_G0285639 isoform X2 [Dysidea avara]|uniref:putative phosphatidylglycerol/phosphatidylinositol transfer protein DDB_G0285639 isoform X2 n=1 Tax=Dysidea avara TaxID=196820 RepID=UPI0033342C4B
MGCIKLIVIFVSLLTSSEELQGQKVTCWEGSCAKRTAWIQNIKVDFNPYPPVIGEDILIQLNGTILEKVTSGRMYVEVRFNNLPPLRETYDLCYALLQFIKVKCPLLAEDANWKIQYKVPNSIIPGNYSGTVTATDQMNNLLFCLNLQCIVR